MATNKKNISIKGIAAGNMFTTKFFLRRIPEIVALAVLAFLYIDNQYYCIAQEIKISKLKQEIQDAKSESLKVEAELTRMCIQSNIEKMVNERNLQIEISQNGKYILEMKDSINN
ncbi:MAG: hypothetical protein LBN23_05735 [Paludibacter sp.]|jgi:hypothetical protein|nr:hypothetical protein [Paludibacter sp.]